MRRAITVAVGISAALAVSLGSASVASAEDPAGDYYNLHYPEACDDPYRSGFKFHIYYNSAQSGAYRNIGYSVYNFDVLRDGSGSYYPLRFCSGGVSSPWPGSGQRIKNNAASGENEHYKYTARVYFSSGYKGVYDAMAPYQHIDQFVNVYNENASFAWA